MKQQAILGISQFDNKKGVRIESYAYAGVLTQQYFNGKKLMEDCKGPEYIRIRRSSTMKEHQACHSHNGRSISVRLFPIDTREIDLYKIHEVQALTNPQIINDIEDALKTGFYKEFIDR